MYRIERTYGNGFRDHLYHLWEGTDLPTFVGPGRNPYLFDDKAEADRVAERLRARYAKTMETPHMPAQAITYTVIEVSEHPYGQYAVYSYDKWQAQFPNAVPAGRYDKLEDAIKHADSVTYKMIVVDMKSDEGGIDGGIVYDNSEGWKEGWDDATLDASEWTKEQAIAYLDSHVELDDDYDRGHRAAIKHLHGIAEDETGEGYDEDWEESLPGEHGYRGGMSEQRYRGYEGGYADL